MDGARLAYALACPANDVTLPDLARLCDVFYIGGTKCGALFGEAVVIPEAARLPHFFTIMKQRVVFPKPDTAPHFFTVVKQHGALLAKGRIAGIQFETLFTDHLYEQLGKNAVAAADRIRAALIEKGYQLAFDAPTNQIFVLLDPAQLANLSAKIEMGFWENTPDGKTIMRIATSWATQPEDVNHLIACL